jgi:hypothetical protein
MLPRLETGAEDADDGSLGEPKGEGMFENEDREDNDIRDRCLFFGGPVAVMVVVMVPTGDNALSNSSSFSQLDGNGKLSAGAVFRLALGGRFLSVELGDEVAESTRGLLRGSKGDVMTVSVVGWKTSAGEGVCLAYGVMSVFSTRSKEGWRSRGGAVEIDV